MDDLTPALTVGAILGLVVGWLMLRGHIPVGALIWDDRQHPGPASYERMFWHPIRRKTVDGWRVMNCVGDGEVADQMIWRSARCLELEIERRQREQQA